MDVKVLRSAKRDLTYVYLRTDVSYEDLPEALRLHFGEATQFLEFELHAGRALAQADTATVLAALEQQGFYLQLPPADDNNQKNAP